jgi:hypothetical protein
VMIFLILLLSANILLAQNANEIVKKAIAKVEENDKKIENATGEFKLKVTFNYNLTVKKATYEFVYDVKFENGTIKERKLASIPPNADSSSLRIAKQIEKVRADENLKIKNLIFPFLRSASNNSSDTKISYKTSGVEKFYGHDCEVVKVEYKINSDTLNAEGTGKIWIDNSSFIPLKCEYEINYQSKRFGKVQNKQFLDVNSLGDIFILSRNETQVFPKVLFIKFGTIKIVYEVLDFKLKNKLGE